MTKFTIVPVSDTDNNAEPTTLANATLQTATVSVPNGVPHRAYAMTLVSPPFTAVQPESTIEVAPGGVATTARTVYAGQTRTDAFPAGVELASNYTTAAGTITSVVREASINGVTFQEAGFQDEPRLEAGQVLTIRTYVQDSSGAFDYFPSVAGVATTVLALPVPAVSTAPVITGGAVVGQTPTVTAAVWQAIPSTPADMTREVQTRFTISGVAVTTPLGPSTEGQQVRAEARARHQLNGAFSDWSAWSQSAPATVGGIVGTSAVDPTYDLTGFVPGDLGVPDAVNFNGGYTGTDIVDLYLATSNSGTPPSAAQMVAGSGGGIIERVITQDFRSIQQDIAGFATTAGVTHVHAYWKERTNGGETAVATVAASSVDFTALAVSSAETDSVDGTKVILTMNDTVRGSTLTAPWTVSGRTVTEVSIASPIITLSVSPVITSDDTVTYSYTPGDLTDERGNALAAITNASVTNNVPASAQDGSWTFLDPFNQTARIEADGTPTETTPNFFPAADTYVVGMATGSGTVDLSIDVASPVTAVTPLVREGSGRVGFYFVTTNGAGGITVRNSINNDTDFRRLVVGTADNLTTTGAISGTASGTEANTQTLTLTGVPEGHVVLAMIVYTGTGSDAARNITWGGSFAAGDEVDEHIRVQAVISTAYKIAPSTGNFTVSATIANSDGTFSWRLAAVALAGA